MFLTLEESESETESESEAYEYVKWTVCCAQVSTEQTRFRVDGYTSPCEKNGFCIGQFTTPETKLVCSKTLLHVGKGALSPLVFSSSLPSSIPVVRRGALGPWALRRPARSGPLIDLALICAPSAPIELIELRA